MLKVLNIVLPQDVSKIVKQLLKPECQHQKCQEETGYCKEAMYCTDCDKITQYFQSWICSHCSNVKLTCYSCIILKCDICSVKMCRECFKYKCLRSRRMFKSNDLFKMSNLLLL